MTQLPWLDLIALTPVGRPDPAIAIAGSRAGAIGVLNLEFAEDRSEARRALETLGHHGRGRLGVLLDGDAASWLDDLSILRVPGLEAVLIANGRSDELTAFVEAVHRGGRKALAVVTSLHEAEVARLAGADALIAKGSDSGGWVGEETAFVLLQRLAPRVPIPIWVQGGIGLHSAAACLAGGAAGVVLDHQLLLTRESPLSPEARTMLSAMDGSETTAFQVTPDLAFRSYARPNLTIVQELRRLEAAEPSDQTSRQPAWQSALRGRIGWGDPDRSAWPLGQDAAFAAGLARRFGTVGGVIGAVRESARRHVESARRLAPLAEGSPLAQSHLTRYPIVQGPMTRVSDRAEFAASVAEAGALPFLALALMRGPEVEPLLAETRERLGRQSWGVGILGFVPPELRAEQLEVVRRFPPPFALIAGGRSDQAHALEADGIATYLHVPSPGLLRLFLEDRARRFVFEGRECGGHVGPRTSFTLWDTMIDVLVDHLDRSRVPAHEYHILFAGGIHDGVSAAMVSALASPLAERGVRLGVLLGTAYLFTEEAVRSGAIQPGFQEAAIGCDRTTTLESGPGHATRCLPSPFAATFAEEKRRLVRQNLPPEELRNRLEMLNIGRLRIASKGLDRNPRFGEQPDASRLLTLGAEEQWERGMYMIGQVAALRDRICTLAELHEDVSAGSVRRLESLRTEPVEESLPPPAAVAIVGMSAILPGAPDLQTYWANILNEVNAITEVPAHRWDWRQYYDPDRSAKDRIYSRWGGFLDDVPFDPIAFGMPPSTISSIEPFQLLALAVVRSALEDAGYLDRPLPRERTSVVFGAGGGGADLTAGYMVRSCLPNLFGFVDAEAIADRLGDALPEWTEDSFAGLLMNVASGRVANRFNLGGTNYTVDAACASSLAAVYLAVRDLEARTSDVAIVGGVDAIQNPFSFLCFSKTQALSPTGRCRPFDSKADGIAISEGFVALVLKRLEDAERDGDRIYAVIRGVGGSSDGRDRSLTAPRPEGQVRALRRAYGQAGFSPSDVGLIEAHGTGTVAGDKAELEALSLFFATDPPPPANCGIGSVKSMIGHTKATAGVAGLAKVALALHHRVLPPTLGVERPILADGPADSPFYVNTKPRPWIQAEGRPRRAGVSAFGFGGTNFHVALEEYTGAFLPKAEAVVDPRPAEVLVWRGESGSAIRESVADLLGQLDRGARPSLADLAYTLALQPVPEGKATPTLAIVATSLEDLSEKLRQALAVLDGDSARAHLPAGLHFASRPHAASGQVAFLFPGQGTQYVNMFRDLAIAFPEFRADLDRAEAVLAGRFPRPLGRTIFPPPAFGAEEERRQREALTETPAAQSALGATELALLRLLRELGIEPQMAAGHSYGEFVALGAAGCFGEDDLLRLSEARGRFIVEGSTGESGAMLAVEAAPEDLRPLLEGCSLTAANLNAPRQTVLSGTTAEIAQAEAWCAERSLHARRLPVACGFHSPLVAPAQRRLADWLRGLNVRPPRIPVYSNTTALPYPNEPSAVVDCLADHLTRPVEFVRQVEAMYEAGARVFVEVGPRRVLSGLVSQILEDRPHFCAPMDQSSRPGLEPFLNGLAALAAEGVAIRWERLYRDRSARRLDLSKLDLETGRPSDSPTTWLVNGGKARPFGQPAGAPTPLHVRVVDDTPPTADTPASHELSGTDPPESAGRFPRFEVSEPYPTHQTPSPTREPVSNEDEEAQTVNQDFATSPPETWRLSPSHAPPPDRAGHPVAAGPALPADIIRQFQHVMQQFLQTQQAVMHDLLSAYRGSEYATSEDSYLPDVGSVALNGHLAPEVRHDEARFDLPPHEWNRRHPEPETNGNTAQAVAPNPPGEARSLIVAEPHQRTTAPRLETPAAPKPDPATGSRPNRQRLVEMLLAIVVDRTGYPAEMLPLDADLEADLGIDSIKRVEIAGTMVRSLAWASDSPPDLEKLTGSRTLQQVVDQLEAMLGVGAPSAREDHGHPFEDGRSEGQIGRYLVEPTFAPPISGSARLAPGGAVVLVDDQTGIGARVAARLAHEGHPVTRIVAAGAGDARQGDALEADLTQPDEVDRVVATLRERHGPAATLIHLAPLRHGADEIGLDPERWRARLSTDLDALFLLARALGPDLERSASRGGAAVLAATALGGHFAADGLVAPAFAGHGGLAGFLKTLALEWPSVRVKALDLGRTDDEVLAESVLAELFADDRLVEVGYRDGQRTTLRMFAAPLPERGPELPLDHDSVVLITGGARGITAEVALRLAEESRPTLILVGRTPLPSGPESRETADLIEPVAVRRALLDLLREDGSTPTAAQVELAYRRLVREREVRRNLQRLRQSGALVEYHVADVGDSNSLGPLIDRCLRIHGQIDGVIHGAGIIEDRLIADKTLDSFHRVLRPKVQGALTLARTLSPEHLRFFALFSSVSARFGNRGQCDYAAANEILNKLAQQLDQTWPGRVVAINWGPWETAGMVSPEVRRQFADRGVALIPVEEGCRRLLDEIRHDGKGEAEVVVAGTSAPSEVHRPDLSPSILGVEAREPIAWPLVASSDAFSRGRDAAELIRTLDTSRDLYLDDHRIDGRPVFPFAMAMELMAETAAAARPDLEIASLSDIRLLKGIALGDEPIQIRVSVRSARGSGADPNLLTTLEATISSMDAKGWPHYRTRIEFGRTVDHGTARHTPGLLPLSEGGPLPMSLDEAYRDWLFHGPVFRGIDRIERIGPEGATALLRTSTPARCLADRPRGNWLFDPVLIDSALQVQLIWSRLHWDMTLLPNVFESYRVLRPLARDRAQGASLQAGVILRHELRIKPGSQPPLCHADHFFFDLSGRLLSVLQGVEGAASRALNRITQTQPV